MEAKKKRCGKNSANPDQDRATAGATQAGVDPHEGAGWPAFSGNQAHFA